MANKLELTWVGKENEIKVEPRILIENPALSNMSHKTAEQASLFDAENADGFDNMLIHGDNLLALKALESKFAGQVKCIYIDPPYNTGNAFEYYDDNREHSIWLSLMYPRLKILRELMREGGSIWVSIDDIEAHRLRVIMDEIFGPSSFVADITYERSGSAGLGQGGLFVNNSEHIIVYSKGIFDYNNVLGSSLLEQKTMKRYNKVLEYEGERELVDEFVSKSNGTLVRIYKHTNFRISSISLRDFDKNEHQIRQNFVLNFDKLFRTNNVQKENEFQNDIMRRMDKRFLYTVDYIPSRGKNKGQETKLYYYNAELFAWLKDTAYIENDNIVKTNKLTTVWRHEEIPKADLANEGGVDFARSKKPEQLIRRILQISTNPGDLVLDSFLGSGTTAAVAQKMNRRWIGIEMCEHAYTHCKKRLDNVINGTDLAGITKAENWKGGGGYRFYELAPTLVVTDKFGNPVINKEYNADMLAAAMALQEGFTYCPDDTFYWKQGKNENAYIFTTTSHVTADYLASIHSEMQDDEYLVIACKTYDSGIEKLFKNITVKKIPQVLLGRCEFGKDDYSLNIVDMPSMEEEDESNN